MYLAFLSIENFRCFGEGEARFELSLKPGLTAFVGENDAGKSAVIDALRFVLGTTDQEWYRLEADDFHANAKNKEIKISCHFVDLSATDMKTFVEYLTYDANGTTPPGLHLHWTARQTAGTSPRRSNVRVDLHSGQDGTGPALSTEVRELLRVTYLRPLRDADRALTSGRGSRLSQILQLTEQIKSGGLPYDPGTTVDINTLNVLGIADLTNNLLHNQTGIAGTRGQIDQHLKSLALNKEIVASKIVVSGADATDEARLRQLLEKLDLALGSDGRAGLGSNNLLFMACELLLLAQDREGIKLLLIEEPEAHLHTQRQLRVMTYLQEQAVSKGIQIIVTTHSPNLASAIDLNNLVMIRRGRAYGFEEGSTELSGSDYRFLKRFLDITKANLFFAYGVLIVEGDAENILLPTIASLLGRSFTEHGVSVVNVGSVGLRRYANIFRRKDTKSGGEIDVPVACVTDMDVMPDCAPVIVEKVTGGKPLPPNRKWKVKSDFSGDLALQAHRKALVEKANGQRVKTFVSDEWTLEYDLALGKKGDTGAFLCTLAEDVYIAAELASAEDAITAGKKQHEDVETSAIKQFSEIKKACHTIAGCSPEEVLASHVYARFDRDRVSKAVAAHFLAERLLAKFEKGDLTVASLRTALPSYLVDAIDYVTGVAPIFPPAAGQTK